MFSKVYRVTQKEFYARPYTSMWAPIIYIYMCVYVCVCIYIYNLLFRPTNAQYINNNTEHFLV